MTIKNIFVVILLVFLFIFTLQNTQVVEVRLFLWTVSMSRALMLLGTLLIGFIAGWFLRSARLNKE
jgi:uncharacterized integral membrane protein